MKVMNVDDHILFKMVFHTEVVSKKYIGLGVVSIYGDRNAPSSNSVWLKMVIEHSLQNGWIEWTIAIKLY